jgi:hypothetical protein
MNAEKLAYWFFRLNGCFTFENFIVHPDRTGRQRTDADLIAVRFQHRSELEMAEHPMPDHELFSPQPRLVNAFLVEAKQGRCRLNGPWTNPERQNLQRVLYAMGFFPQDRVAMAASALYENLRYDDDLVSIQFVAAGNERVGQGRTTEAIQLTWSEMLAWIHRRFHDYMSQKAHHPQWDGSAKRLFQSAVRKFGNDEIGFVTHWLQQIGVSSQGSRIDRQRSP